MSPRRYTRRSVPAPPSEVPEQAGPPEVPESAGPSEVQDLLAQVIALAGQFGRLQELMEQQMAAATATATGNRDPPAPSMRALEVAEGECIAAVPVAARPSPASVPLAASGSTTLDAAAEEAERERGYTALTRFMKFHPPTFDGEVIDPWTVETWLAMIETLFEDIYTREQDKVHLAAHCFDKRARVWWRRVKQDRSPDLPPVDWEEFRGLMFVEYFPDSDKRKMREDFRKLKQGNRTVREYEREFTHLLNCVPDVARTEQDWAECFVRGLRPEIFRMVHAFKFRTFAEVLDRALWVKHENACVREEREAFEEDKGKKRPGDSCS
uniref:Retrotransposon gag domain-containing protein n=1 Tax=Ananas comosus var. bracteatus TaxID=296719 RepID=A0A6V7PH39_ANACO|nr:unnamed protein product [Ananas comosus var. bracteatus]